MGARREPRRQAQRYRFDDPAGIEVCIIHPGGTQACFRVVPRDLSAGGLRFEHNNFLYPGSACRCTLRSRSKALVAVAGRLVRCTHVSGRTHEIGVQFDASVNVAQFVDVDKDLIEAEAAPLRARRD